MIYRPMGNHLGTFKVYDITSILYEESGTENCSNCRGPSSGLLDGSREGLLVVAWHEGCSARI